MANFGRFREAGANSVSYFIENAGARRLNEANRVYERSVDDMFGRLHTATGATTSPSQYNSSDYERKAFATKADMATFVKDMQEQGIDVAYSPKTMMGQYLVEIPRNIDYNQLNPNGYLAQQMAGSGMSSISCTDIFSDACQRMDLHVDEPLPTHYMNEQDNVRVEGNLYTHLTKHMDALGTVINKVVELGNMLEVYGYNSDKEVFNTPVNNRDYHGDPQVKTGQTQRAVVINDDLVMVGGKLVTDDATRNSILERHHDRINEATQHVNDYIADQNAAAAFNKKSAASAQNYNDHIHKENNTLKNALSGSGVSGAGAIAGGVIASVATGGMGGVALGLSMAAGAAGGAVGSALNAKNKEVYHLDFNNANAVSEMRQALAAKGFNWDDPTHTHSTGKGDDKHVSSMTFRNGSEVITVNHKHKEAATREAQLKPIIANSEAITKSIYKQEYASTRDFKTQTFCKDLSLNQSQSDLLFHVYSQDTRKFTKQEAFAIHSLHNNGTASNLSFSEREALIKKLDSVQRKTGAADGELSDWKSIKNELKLSDVEKAQKNEMNGSDGATFVRVDFALGALNDVANSLNAAYNIANFSRSYGSATFSLADYGGGKNIFSDMGAKGSKLGLTQEQSDVLAKVNLAMANGKNVDLSATERNELASALEKYKKDNASNLSKEERDAINNFLSGKCGKLTPEEAQAIKDMASIQKDLGIKMSMANFNAEKILELNKVFLNRAKGAGIDVFTKVHGKWKIDPKKIAALSDKQLKMLGISKNTQNMLVRVNGAQVKGPNIAGGVQSILSLMCRADESGSISEVMGVYTKYKRGIQYTKSSIVFVRQRIVYIKQLRSARRADKISKYGQGPLKPRKPKNKNNLKKAKPVKPPKAVDAKILARRSDKVIKKQAKALKRAARRERSLLGRFNALKTKVMGKFASTAVGKVIIGAKTFISGIAMKAAIIVSAVFFLLAGTLVVAMIAIQSISAFLDKINPVNIIDNALAAETYKDTVAWRLYEDMLRPMEEDWIKNNVLRYDATTDDRIHNYYGAEYEKFQPYISKFNNLVLLDDDKNGYYSDIYINPFHQNNAPVTGTQDSSGKYPGTMYTYLPSINTDILSPALPKDAKRYDGEQVTTFGANNNIYDKINTASDPDDPEAVYLANSYGYSSVESGHTSNIKDILCMVDVMYKMDMDEACDDSSSSGVSGSIDSVLGKTPEQITWEEVVDNTKGFFKWLWNTIKSPFTDAKYKPLKDFCSGRVGYKTICKYAETLFTDSHQEELAFDVKYYKYDKIMINVAGEGMVDITDSISQEQASILGYCKSPVKRDFYLFWNVDSSTGVGRVSPFFYENGDESTGKKYPVDKPGVYDITVGIEQCTDKVKPKCLIPDMAEDEETFKFCRDQAKSTTVPEAQRCWEVTAEGAVEDSQTAYESSSGGIGEYFIYDPNNDNIPDPVPYDCEGCTFKPISVDGWFNSEDEARNSVISKLQSDFDTATVPSGGYHLGAYRDSFTKEYIERPDSMKASVDVTPATVLTGGKTRVVDSKDLVLYDSDDNEFKRRGIDKDIWSDRISFDSSSEDSNWHLKIRRMDGTEEDYDTGYPESMTMSYGFEEHVHYTPDYKTIYSASGSALLYEKKKDSFARHCKGHEFTYCGGHLCVHSHGVTYSITNEQIDVLDQQDEFSGEPIADGYDLEKNGYSDLKGKVITNEVNYNTAYTASTTGGCRSPLYDPQGSASGMFGLNVKNNGDEWASGYGVRSTVSTHDLRDIFDVDCLILKGDNIFPIDSTKIKGYEGWNEDNLTSAVMKFSSNWYEEYEFDIPQEICYGKLKTYTYKDDEGNEKVGSSGEGYNGAGQAPISEVDINTIIDALKKKYGSTFTKKREDAVRQTLGYVGKGHYNELHNHNFLACQCDGISVDYIDKSGKKVTVDYDGCCTAGDERGFVNFIRHHNGLDMIDDDKDTSFSFEYRASDKSSNAVPGDAIIHRSTGSMTDVVISSSQRDKLVGSSSDDYKRYFVKQLEDATRSKYCVFIGILDENIKLTSTGQELEAGVPIVVDLSAMNAEGIDGLGNIYLHGMASEDDFSQKSFSTYSWLTGDTTRTYVKSFS